jgi:hypothetical protein
MKKTFIFFVALGAAALRLGPVSADMAPQPQVTFAQSAANTFAADWQGVAGRIYFMQWTTNLLGWSYAPFLDFGDGMHSRGMAGSSPNIFVRLHCIDDPAITSLEEAMNADFDGDGLSNIFELTFGYDPFDPESTADGPDNALDPDEDGLGNTSEQAMALNPMAKDNPIVQLEVVVE